MPPRRLPMSRTPVVQGGKRTRLCAGQRTVSITKNNDMNTIKLTLTGSQLDIEYHGSDLIPTASLNLDGKHDLRKLLAEMAEWCARRVAATQELEPREEPPASVRGTGPRRVAVCRECGLDIRQCRETGEWEHFHPNGETRHMCHEPKPGPKHKTSGLAESNPRDTMLSEPNSLDSVGQAELGEALDGSGEVLPPQRQEQSTPNTGEAQGKSIEVGSKWRYLGHHASDVVIEVNDDIIITESAHTLSEYCWLRDDFLRAHAPA